MLCYVMLCYVMLCYVMLCYVMLCYVMLCYVMLCYVMLCYVMLRYQIIGSPVIYVATLPTVKFEKPVHLEIPIYANTPSKENIEIWYKTMDEGNKLKFRSLLEGKSFLSLTAFVQ